MLEVAVIKKFYLVETLFLWKSLKTADGGMIAVDTKAIGFCPVFETEEQAKAAFPGEDIQTLVISYKTKNG